MFNRKAPDGLVDHAVATADAAVEGTQRLAGQASSMAHQGMEVLRDASHLVGHGAQLATDKTVAYIREEPIKALLMATVATAGLIAVAGLFTRFGRLHR